MHIDAAACWRQILLAFLLVCPILDAGGLKRSDLAQLEADPKHPHSHIFSPIWSKRTDLPSFDKNLPDLSGLTVFWWGDSTLRQVLHATLQQMGATAMSGGDFKKYTRQCPQQNKHRERYHVTHEDGAPCWENEHTCANISLTGSKMGKKVKLTWDWKHLMYEGYDIWRIREWVAHPQTAPDLLVLGPGLHDCFHHPLDGDAHVQQFYLFVKELLGLPMTTQVLILDIVPFPDACCDKDALPCVKQLNKAMLDLFVHLEDTGYAHNLWLLRRSHVISTSKKHLVVHQSDDLIQALARFALLHVSHIITDAKAARRSGEEGRMDAWLQERIGNGSMLAPQAPAALPQPAGQTQAPAGRQKPLQQRSPAAAARPASRSGQVDAKGSADTKPNATSLGIAGTPRDDTAVAAAAGGTVRNGSRLPASGAAPGGKRPGHSGVEVGGEEHHGKAPGGSNGGSGWPSTWSGWWRMITGHRGGE